MCSASGWGERPDAVGDLSTDGWTHSLLPVGDHLPGVLQTRCGHLLPMGVQQHDHLPGWQLCASCLWCYLVPTRVLPPENPAGRPVES